MKRPLSNKRPIGPFFQSANSSSCTVCYGEASKKEVFKSIQESFLNRKDIMKSDMESVGLDINKIAITGSVADYTFGCSQVNEARGWIDVFIREVWPSMGVSDEQITSARTVYSQESIEDMWRVAQKEAKSLENDESFLFDIRTFICSDIDIFVEEKDDSSVDEWESEEMSKIKTRHINKIDNDTVGLLVPEINFTSEHQGISEPYIIDEDDFNKVVQ